ncbi:MAG: winged helix-turn-helix domain-containing protein [Candidatus Bathyarchaeia archaeon]
MEDTIRKRQAKTRIEKIKDILVAASDGTTRRQIMQLADLSYPLVEEYVNFLAESKLVIRRRQRGYTVYKITRKGAGVLRCLREIDKLLA